MLRRLVLALVLATAHALVLGSAAASVTSLRASQPRMMPPFLKKLGLTKPGESAVAVATEAPSPVDILTARPARAAMALAWISFSVYVAAFSPGSFDISPDSFDNKLIASAIEDPASLNPIFFAIFNALGLIPAVNMALLFPGSRDQTLPTAPFVVSSFALGFGAVGPYLALRQPRPEPLSAADLGFFGRNVLESRLYGLGLTAGALALAVTFAGGLAEPQALSEFADLFGSSKLVHVSTIDLTVLSAFAFEPIREDMCRRGWWDEAGPTAEERNRLLAFCFPVLGPAAYVLLRPALDQD